MSKPVMPTKFLIDGIDRLGKSSLIEGIQQELGYHLVIHYDKPKVLATYESIAMNSSAISLGLSKENVMRGIYQEKTNEYMFQLLKTQVPIIFDRTHLGEMVYAPLYRGYSGNYVLSLENRLLDSTLANYTQAQNIRLILLTSSNVDMLQDDGLSFDPTKKSEEQNLFIDAFNMSRFSNKIMIDVHDGNGGYRPYSDILYDALYKK